MLWGASLPLLTCVLWIDDVRNRQLRLFNIQRLITARLGFERRPNMSAMSALSAERLRSTMQRHRLDAAHSEDVHLPHNYLAHRVITLLPACNHRGLCTGTVLITFILRLGCLNLGVWEGTKPPVQKIFEFLSENGVYSCAILMHYACNNTI